MPFGRQQTQQRPRTAHGSIGRGARPVPSRPVVIQRIKDEPLASPAEKVIQQTKKPQTEIERIIIPKEAWVSPPIFKTEKVKDEKSETAENPLPQGRRRRVREVKAKEPAHEEAFKPLQARTRIVDTKLDVRSNEDDERAERVLGRGRRKGVLANKPGVHSSRYNPKRIDERHIKRPTIQLQQTPAQRAERTQQTDQQKIPTEESATPKRLPIPRDDIEKRKIPENAKKDIPRPPVKIESKNIEKEVDAAYLNVARLNKVDVMAKARFINDVVEKEIISKIVEIDSRFSFDILHAGSYYEYLKVGEADEVDIMVKLNANMVSRIFKVKVCPARRFSPLTGFAYLEYQNHVDAEAKWRDLLVEGPDKRQVLSPGLILEQFKLLLTRRLQKMNSAKKRPWKKSMEPILNGPAVQLTFHLPNGTKLDTDIVLCVELCEWPSVANNWGILQSNKKWPSKNTVEQIKEKGCHVVPKIHTSDNRCWRLSFSMAEKTLLSPRAINEDKKYYKIVKLIFERHKSELEPLCSYHLKTLLLHMRTNGKFHGTKLNGIEFVEHFIQELVQKLQAKELPHYFIGHTLNLFNEMSIRRASTITDITDCLERIFSDRETIRELVKDLGR